MTSWRRSADAGEAGSVTPGSGCRERLAPDREQGAVDHVVFCGGARDDDVDAGGDGRVLAVGHRLDAVVVRELRAAARRGVDPHVGDPAVAQRGERRAGEAARADEQHSGLRPVRDAALGEVEGEAHERAALAADARLVLDPPRGLRGALEEALELGGGGAVGAGLFERAAHLAGDLALADDDGFEAGCHGEQVPGDGIAVHEAEGAAQLVGLEAGHGAHGPDRLVHRGHRRGALGRLEVEVGLEPVAGGHDDRAVHGVMPVEDAGRRLFRVRRKTLEHVEPGVLVTRGEADEHQKILPAVERRFAHLSGDGRRRPSRA